MSLLSMPFAFCQHVFVMNSCKHAGVLEGRIVWGVDRQPKSLQRARANIRAGLGQLGMLTAQTCPKGLVHEVEHILQVRLVSLLEHGHCNACVMTA